jgi:hypothetical protein
MLGRGVLGEIERRIKYDGSVAKLVARAVEVRALREREYPRDGADAYGALPDTALVYQDTLPKSELGKSPLYVLGDKDGVIPEEPKKEEESAEAEAEANANAEANAEAKADANGEVKTLLGVAPPPIATTTPTTTAPSTSTSTSTSTPTATATPTPDDEEDAAADDKESALRTGST